MSEGYLKDGNIIADFLSNGEQNSEEIGADTGNLLYMGFLDYSTREQHIARACQRREEIARECK